MFGADALAAHRRRAAELLESEGASEGVFELYRDAGDWVNAVRVTLADAPEMLAQGRFQSMLERVGALPALAREAEPWLAYWEGVARVNVDPLAARVNLERAYNGFVARGDTAAQIQAVEAVIVSHYLAWDDWRPVDRWTEVMEKLLARSRAFESPEAEARALSSLAIGLVYRQPGHPLLEELLGRLTALLDEVRDRNLQVAMATRLLDGLNKAGAFAQSQRIATRIRAVMDDPDVRPLTSTWCRVWLSNLYYFQARFDDFERVLDEAIAIAEAHGLALPRADDRALPRLGPPLARRAARGGAGPRPACRDARTVAQARSRAARLPRVLERGAARRFHGRRAPGTDRGAALARDRLGRLHADLPHRARARARRDRPVGRGARRARPDAAASSPACAAGSCATRRRSGRRICGCAPGRATGARRSPTRSRSGGARVISTTISGGRR